MAGLEWYFDLCHSKLLSPRSHLPWRRENGGWGQEIAKKRKKKRYEEKEKQREREISLSKWQRREERDKQQEQSGGEEERKARHGKIGAETKGQRDRQRQVEKIAET